MLAEWALAAAPDLESDGDADRGISKMSPRLGEDYDVDMLEVLETAVTCAPNPLAAVKEARVWQEIVAPSQGNLGGSVELPARTRARHMLGLVGCCPTSELESIFPSLVRELLALLRRRVGGSGSAADVEARSTALAAIDELVRRMLEKAAAPGADNGSGGAVVVTNKVGRGELGGARQVVVSFLPKLVPAVAACLEGSTNLEDGSSLVPPPPAVATGALGVLEAFAFLLRSTMRPHVKRVQDVTAPWLQGPDDAMRDRAAAVLASLPLCSEGDAWTLAAGKVALEAHSLLQMAWPDDDVDMGSDMGASQLNNALSADGGLLPPLSAEAGGFPGPQQALAVLVLRRFKGLCRVLELMLSGDSDGRVVSVPVPLILALVERVQRMTPNLKVKGPQAFVPVAQGALSHGALRTIYSALSIVACRLLDALAATPRPTVLRNGRRYCRALIQGIARPSTAGSLRAAGYRSVARALLQLGAGASLDLAMPALPALLEEVRVIVEVSEPQITADVRGSNTASGMTVSTAWTGATVPRYMSSPVGTTASGGMRIEPTMSARKSSQKKQRKLREREVGRALAAADAAVAASATGLMSASNGAQGGRDSMEVGLVTGGSALAEREAMCAALACTARLVGCCRGHLPLAGRQAVEDVLYRGLDILARAGEKSFVESLGAGTKRAPSRAGSLRLMEPLVAREFVRLAQECLVTPLADGTRSGALSIALAACRSLESHPDERLAAASQRALTSCGSILYPRAAPLHLPHAVTSQARAWGTDRHELPIAWGGRLTEAGADSTDDDAEGKEGRADSATGKLLSLDWAPRETQAVVAAPSAETSSNLLELPRGPRSDPPSAVLLESITDNDVNDQNAPDQLQTSKGKGKDKKRTTASGTGETEAIITSSSKATLKIRELSGAIEAEAEEDNSETQRPKRPRLHEEELETVETQDDGVGYEETSPPKVPRGGHQLPPKEDSVAVPGRGHGTDGSDNDKGSDDDDFDFPSIVDADPDSD